MTPTFRFLSGRYRLFRQVDPDQGVPRGFGERCHQAGLPHAGGALQQHGPLQLQGPQQPLGVHGRCARGDGVVGQVPALSLRPCTDRQNELDHITPLTQTCQQRGIWGP